MFKPLRSETITISPFVFISLVPSESEIGFCIKWMIGKDGVGVCGMSLTRSSLEECRELAIKHILELYFLAYKQKLILSEATGIEYQEIEVKIEPVIIPESGQMELF